MSVRGRRSVGKAAPVQVISCLAVVVVALTSLLIPARPARAAGLRYSQTPSNTEPYAACPPPTSDQAQCQVIIDPKSSLPAPVTTEQHPSNPGASPEIGSQVSCREVFPGSEYEGCGSGANHGFSPEDLQSAYKLPFATAGAGQTVAIVDAYDDPNAQADLNVYRATYDLPPCESGCLTKVSQTGGTTYPEASASWATEISLDLDMVSAACPKCHILLVEAKSNTLENLGIAENEAATLGATEISNSYAANENEVGKAQLEEDSKYYNHSGVPITVASGDDSWDDTNPCKEENEKCVNVSPNFPADLSDVIAVGGTTLRPEGETGRGWKESVWFYSGSGCTLYVAKPTWQTDKGCKNRTDNDVAAVAEGMSIYDTYSSEPGWKVVGGTSVATPLTAGAIALESSALRAEGIEGIYKHTGNWFNVTEGINYPSYEKCTELYLCSGGVGYNGPSGVGTPDGGTTGTPPSAWTEPASAVTTSAGTLNGIVNPEAGAGTTYYFQYGASKYYGRAAPAGGAKASGYTEPSRVSQGVSGLKPSTMYHFRVVATNANGTTYGADQTFSTAAKVYVSKFGSKGSAEGQFTEPEFTATNREGDVWVSDYTNDRVEEFSPSGTFMKSCGKAGSGEVQFKGPTGIAVDYNGQLYVSDSGNNRIEVIGQNCSYWDSFGQGYLSDPMGLTFTTGGEFSKGLVLIANAGGDDIELFNTTTEVISEKRVQRAEGSYGTKGSGDGQFLDPTDIVAAAKENEKTELFYAVDSGNNRVEEFSVSGLYTGGEEELTYKFDEVFGSKGSGEGQLSSPIAVAVDPSTGDVDVTDTGNNRVEQFLPSGTYISTFGSAGSGNGSFDEPKGIAASATGKLYIADALNDRVSVWGSSEVANPEWFITTTPNPVETLNSYLWGTSCTTSPACTAVGEYESGLTSYKPLPLVERWNGAEWVIQTTPYIGEPKEAALDGVACASATICMAVGLDEHSSGTYYSLSESWNGTEWQVKTTPEPGGTLNSSLDAVSCTSASACIAVGEYENSPALAVPFAESWNGTEWKVQAMPAPTGAKAAYATGVSCTSATTCTMVGTYESSASVYVPYAESWNGTEWKLQSMPTPTGATATRMHGGVSCTSSTACTGVGYYVNSSGVWMTLAERWNGTEWTVQSSPDPSGAKTSYFSGVSCTTSTECTAVGVSESSEKYVTLAEHWNGAEWQIQSTPNGENGTGHLTGGVSCVAAPSPCLAVGNTGKTFAEIYG
jgi:NHL repeat